MVLDASKATPLLVYTYIDTSQYEFGACSLIILNNCLIPIYYKNNKKLKYL